MSRTPTEEVLERLARLPHAAHRAILAEWDRARIRKGGDIHLVIRVLADGRETVVIPTEYERREGGGI
jgi:hypothetical protein